ncbi:MAG TPA: iron-containing alcohol dehydrogenase [Verrucomicrobiae bacterium]|nr:iron-containing alcohol dehydrogenase [Verrucomicrobiae bacterium]
MSAPGPLAAFGVARLPRIVFGAGRVRELPAIAAGFGSRVLLVTGGRSFREGPAWEALVAGLAAAGVSWSHLAVTGEPSPDLVDGTVADARRDPPDLVVGIGGGAALDTAKAVAGLLRSGTSVLDHLEGVGRNLPYPGPATPFVAVPTTAGTGSEATKNAVISGRLPGAGAGDPPFKKSFRDDRLVAAVALVDPDLLAGCPPAVIAGEGMDALTQLLEALTSTGASSFTDAVARSGLAAIGTALPAWHAAAIAGAGAADTADARGAMAWAALCSGIALANAGLGAAHGLVAPLGARFGIHHGTGCGALLAAVTHANLAALAERAPGSPALLRYADAGRLLAGGAPSAGAALSDDEARDALLATLDRLTAALGVPRLGTLGVSPDAFPALVAESRGSSMRTNPVVLTDTEIEGILAASL